MTDELDALKAALRAPAPDPAAKDAALRLAMENFDRLQETAPRSRPNWDRPKGAGFRYGVRAMIHAFNSRPVLAATTSVAALCVGLVVILPLTGPLSQAPLAVQTPKAETAAPEAARKVAPEVVAPVEADQALAELPLEEVTPAAPMPSLVAPKAMPASGGIVADIAQPQPENTEAFANAAANPVKVTKEEPVSTFSIDVDTASYAVVRSSLNSGLLPDPASVRIEEMVNYFPYAYATPAGDQAFRPSIAVMQTPWNPDTRLVRIALQGAMPALDNRPPLNLVFLIDTSGSMDEPNKLPLLKQSLALMLDRLQLQDQVAIVAYAGSAGQVLPPTAANDRAAILGSLDRLAAGGATAGAEGLQLAYQVAESMSAKGEVSRVLLATDGDFNVGLSDPAALESYIADKRKSGVYLSVLGFGRGNLDDATMQALAQNGNGTAAYIDTLSEARKVLVDQVAGALYPIADNVKIQVEWNPAQVAEYRLIGYETRALRREDFNNDKIDAGEIGAGTAVTALYEITAPDSPALRNDPLRYGAAAPATGSDELGFLRLRSVAPGQTASTLQETPIFAGGAVDDDARFAAAIAGFGQLLTGATYLGDWGWDQAIDLALSARGEDAYGYRIEAVNLMRMAQALSAR
jgi:Ca-activated chloride channel family protein